MGGWVQKGWVQSRWVRSAIAGGRTDVCLDLIFRTDPVLLDLIVDVSDRNVDLVVRPDPVDIDLVFEKFPDR